VSDIPGKILQKLVIKAFRLLGAGIGFELRSTAMDAEITEYEHGQCFSHFSGIVVEFQF
jgi:hypothetical protein